MGAAGKPTLSLSNYFLFLEIINLFCSQYYLSLEMILVDIEIEFELTLLTYKVFSCKDVRSKFLGVRLLAVQSNTQSRS